MTRETKTGDAAVDADSRIASIVDENTVVIFDETQNLMNIRSATFASVHHILGKSKHNLFMSATPFTDPAANPIPGLGLAYSIRLKAVLKAWQDGMA